MMIRVLAVDDELEVLRLIDIKLRKAGFAVFTARDGEEGLRKVVAEKPDVVLLDIMMPKMNGHELARRIKAEVTPAPIILMLTAQDKEEDLVRALSGSADDYIVKPFSPRELVSRINVALVKAGRSPQDS